MKNHRLKIAGFLLLLYKTEQKVYMLYAHAYILNVVAALVPVHEQPTEILLNCYLIVHLDTRYKALECIKILASNFAKRI